MLIYRSRRNWRGFSLTLACDQKTKTIALWFDVKLHPDVNQFPNKGQLVQTFIFMVDSLYEVCNTACAQFILDPLFTTIFDKENMDIQSIRQPTSPITSKETQLCVAVRSSALKQNAYNASSLNLLLVASISWYSIYG